MIRISLLFGLLLIPAISVTGLSRNEIVTPEDPHRLVIGVHIADMGAPLAAQLGLELRQGILITHVSPGLPADQSGVQQYDVITAVQGQPVTSRSSLARALGLVEVGDEVVLTLIRQARPLELGVEVIADPAAGQRLEALRALGYVGGQTAVDRIAIAAELAAQEKALAEHNRDAAHTARSLLNDAEDRKAQHDLEQRHRAAAMSDNLRVLQESLARSRNRQNRALEQLHSQADTISDRLHRHLKEMMARHKSISDEEVVHAEGIMQQATRAYHNAIASVHDRLKAREMQIIERENSLPDVVVGQDDLPAGRWVPGRTHSGRDVEHRLQSIDERLVRIEKALAEMRERQTD